MKLIVGLGNPGRRYQDTRHNVGYRVVGELARRFGTSKPSKKFSGEVVEAVLPGAGPAGERVLLLSPTTYMNRSGGSVQEARAFYKLPLEEILVVCDDMNLPPGKLRVRPCGSAGGQKGLVDIIARLGEPDVPRLRIGIGSPPEGWDGADFVLSRFKPAERELIDDAVAQAVEAAIAWARDGVKECMNRFNGPSCSE